MQLSLLLVSCCLTAAILAHKQLRRPGGGGKGGHIVYSPINNAKIRCNKRDSFRSIDGLCNNLGKPHLGAANSKLGRIFPAEYFDCSGTPKGGYEDETFLQNGYGSHHGIQKPKLNTTRWTSWHNCKVNSQQLPNVREVSSTFHPDQNIPQNKFSLMVMQFGQFLDHDMALTPEVVVEGCCEHPQQEDCFPIYIPNKDPFYSTRGFPPNCLEFTRSEEFRPNRFSWHFRRSAREQFSVVTSFIDGSQIYSPNNTEALLLRSLQGGELKTNSNFTREILPVINGNLMAGDLRALDMPGLATIHTLFLREHNRIARSLSSKYTNDEEIYQQARRIVIAELQNIVYGEYLPVILGKDAIKKYKLSVTESTKYKKKKDPSIINSFTTAAFRFGHSLIQGMVNMADPMDPDSLLMTYQLHKNFFNMDNYLLDDGQGMDRIIAGLLGQGTQTMDRFVTEDVTNFLFMEVGEDTGNTKRDFGADLVARNLQRGRDHGLRGYNKYRKYCGLKSLPNFKERSPPEISSTNWKILAELYRSPDDIDLFVGGLAEFPHADGLMGPTFNCIISKQFKKLMDGDRFFFTHDHQVGSFSTAQLSQLRKRTLRDIICENTEIVKTRENVFLLHGEMLDCTNIHTLDLTIFK